MLDKAEGKQIVQEISFLEENWNDNGANPFSKKLIDRAYELLDKLDKVPNIRPTANDSIQFEYKKTNGEYLEFELFEDGLKAFMIKDSVVYQSRYIDMERAKEMVNNFYDM